MSIEHILRKTAEIEDPVPADYEYGREECIFCKSTTSDRYDYDGWYHEPDCAWVLARQHFNISIFPHRIIGQWVGPELGPPIPKSMQPTLHGVDLGLVSKTLQDIYFPALKEIYEKELIIFKKD